MNICNHQFRSGLLGAVLLATISTAAPADAPVPLKDAFKQHFRVGAAVNRSMVTVGAGFRRSAEQNAKDIALLKEQFNQISPENDLKWQLIHPREGANGYDFDPADAFVNFGLSNICISWATPSSGIAKRRIGLRRHEPTATNAITSATAQHECAATNQFGQGRFGGGFGRYNGPRASREELLERMSNHIHTVVTATKAKSRSGTW
jgi:GH35 family endo-1,4-beta-xylanase